MEAKCKKIGDNNDARRAILNHRVDCGSQIRLSQLEKGRLDYVKTPRLGQVRCNIPHRLVSRFNPRPMRKQNNGARHNSYDSSLWGRRFGAAAGLLPGATLYSDLNIPTGSIRAALITAGSAASSAAAAIVSEGSASIPASVPLTP